MANKTLSENINQAISDFSGIKQAIIDKGVEVPSGTPTSQYGTKIGEIQSGGGSGEDFKGVIERTATNLTLPSGLTKIGDYAFFRYKNLVLTMLPNGVTSIGNSAFDSCTNLALTSLPNGLTSIDTFAFSICTNLALTSLPNGLTSIGRYAFQRCTNLALTSLPDTLTDIADYAFSGCTGLTEITFKVKPNHIYTSIFERCTNLTTIRVPWAEGEVFGAPFGATNATLIYNYTET